MKLSLDPSITRPRDITSESLALARWYDAHPDIQRLWGIRDAKAFRVVVLIGPTHDGDDVYPAWLANGRTWARELRSLTGRTVQLELADVSSLDGIELRAESVIVADLLWRDATLTRSHSAV